MLTGEVRQEWSDLLAGGLDPPLPSATRHRHRLPASVLGLARVDLVDPLQDAALQVLHVGKPTDFRKSCALALRAAHLALRDDFAVTRQFLVAPRQLAERNQRRARRSG